MAPPEFITWLKREMKSKNLGIRETARLVGVSHPIISNIVNFSQKPSLRVAKLMAVAFNESEETILRLAGLLDPIPEEDALIERARHIIASFEHDETKQRALDYLELLLEQEARARQGEGRNHASKTRKPKTSLSG